MLALLALLSASIALASSASGPVGSITMDGNNIVINAAGTILINGSDFLAELDAVVSAFDDLNVNATAINATLSMIARDNAALLANISALETQAASCLSAVSSYFLLVLLLLSLCVRRIL